MLERVTAVVLGLVLLALGWVLAMAYKPEWGRGVATDVQVILLLILLAAALVLVSIVALLRTRP